MKTRRRGPGWKWVAAVLIVLAGAYFSRGFLQRFQKTYPANAFHTVKRGDMLISLTEEGALRALNETVIRSGLEGFNRIIHLVPEGSYVEKGDLLVELDSSGLKDRLNEQELLHQERLFQMLQATANLSIQKSLVESQIKAAELRVENAQSDYEKYRDGDGPLLIKIVQARSGVLAEQVRIASERYARTEELVRAGNASKSELEADGLSLKREQLALEQYQEDLRLIKKYDQPNQLRLLRSQVEQAQAELERLKQRTSNEIAQAEADLKTSQAALEVLKQNVETLRQRLEYTKILAPQNGLVVYAQVSPFQFGGGDEGRFRGGGGRGGRGDGGDFRAGGGGGRRGGRSNLDGSGGGSSTSGGAGTTEAMAAANQRIASAISGSSVTDPNAGSGGGTGGGSASAGGRSGGGGGGGGQNAGSAASAFASYQSMRANSAFRGSGNNTSAAGNNPSGANNNSASGSGSSTGGTAASPGRDNTFAGNPANLFGFRSGSQGFRDFGGFELSGTPGVLEEGTMVRQRQELIRLPDVSKMLAEIRIEESRVRQVRAGMTAYIRVNNIPHRHFKGTVRRVALLPDSQASWMNPNVKVFPTDILVDEELPILRPGVSATAEIIITNLHNVLSVPIQTVTRLNGENVCFVKRGAVVRPVPVATGFYNDAFVQIISGLNDGDLVLLAPVGDEEVEEAPGRETNNVENAVSARPPPAIDGSPGEERRFQRRDAEPMPDEPAERPRNRQRRERAPQTSPE